MTVTPRTRQRRSREQWQQLITEQQQSGLSQKAFCQGKGLVLSTFTYWKRRLGEPTSSNGPAEGHWLELPVSLTEGPSTGWDIELELGGGLCLRLRQR